MTESNERREGSVSQESEAPPPTTVWVSLCFSAGKWGVGKDCQGPPNHSLSWATRRPYLLAPLKPYQRVCVQSAVNESQWPGFQPFPGPDHLILCGLQVLHPVSREYDKNHVILWLWAGASRQTSWREAHWLPKGAPRFCLLTVCLSAIGDRPRTGPMSVLLTAPPSDLRQAYCAPWVHAGQDWPKSLWVLVASTVKYLPHCED